MIMIAIEIPDGVRVEIKDNAVSVQGSLGTNQRTFNKNLLFVKKADNKIEIDFVKSKKLQEKAEKVEKAFKKELENDIQGVGKYFEKKMKIVFAHFPITAIVKENNFYINNMIGERVPRIAKIVGSTKIEVKGQEVRLYGTKLDDVSQTAANIIKTCKIRDKDGRVFQDGLYYDTGE